MKEKKGDFNMYDPNKELKRLLSQESATTVAPLNKSKEASEIEEEIKDAISGKQSYLRLDYKELVASQQVLVEGQVQVYWEVKDRLLHVSYRNAAVPVSINTAYYPYVVSKGLKVFRINCYDPEIRLLIIQKVLKDAWNQGVKKFGKPKFGVTKDADGSEFNIFVGFREVFNEIVGDELSLYPMIKPWAPCCTIGILGFLL
jgi:hypothetical protein